MESDCSSVCEFELGEREIAPTGCNLDGKPVHGSATSKWLLGQPAEDVGLSSQLRVKNKKKLFRRSSRGKQGGAGQQSGMAAPDSKELLTFTFAELAKFNGQDKSLPTLLAVCGRVFDVSNGRNSQMYLAGGYHCFAGRDASCVFATGKFDDAEAVSAGWDYSVLDGMELAQVYDWLRFYSGHAEYTEIGRLLYPNRDDPKLRLTVVPYNPFRVMRKALRAAGLVSKKIVNERFSTVCMSVTFKNEFGGLLAFDGGCVAPHLLVHPVPLNVFVSKGDIKCAANATVVGGENHVKHVMLVGFLTVSTVFHRFVDAYSRATNEVGPTAARAKEEVARLVSPDTAMLGPEEVVWRCLVPAADHLLGPVVVKRELISAPTLDADGFAQRHAVRVEDVVFCIVAVDYEKYVHTIGPAAVEAAAREGGIASDDVAPDSGPIPLSTALSSAKSDAPVDLSTIHALEARVVKKVQLGRPWPQPLNQMVVAATCVGFNTDGSLPMVKSTPSIVQESEPKKGDCTIM